MIETFEKNGNFLKNDSIYVVAENEQEAKKEAHKLLDKFIGEMLHNDYARGTYRFTATHEFQFANYRSRYEQIVCLLACLFNQNEELNMLYVSEQDITIHCDCDRLNYNELKWESIVKLIDEIENQKGHGLNLIIKRT